MAEGLATDSPGQVEVLGIDGHSLGVKRAEIDVLEEPDHIGLGGLLQSVEGRGLEAEFSVCAGGDLTDQSLEGEPLHEGPGGLLVPRDGSFVPVFLLPPDLSHGDSAWSPPHFLPHFGDTALRRG